MIILHLKNFMTYSSGNTYDIHYIYSMVIILNLVFLKVKLLLEWQIKMIGYQSKNMKCCHLCLKRNTCDVHKLKFHRQKGLT